MHLFVSERTHLFVQPKGAGKRSGAPSRRNQVEEVGNNGIYLPSQRRRGSIGGPLHSVTRSREQAKMAFIKIRSRIGNRLARQFPIPASIFEATWVGFRSFLDAPYTISQGPSVLMNVA